MSFVETISLSISWTVTKSSTMPASSSFPSFPLLLAPLFPYSPSCFYVCAFMYLYTIQNLSMIENILDCLSMGYFT